MVVETENTAAERGKADRVRRQLFEVDIESKGVQTH